MSRCSRVDVQLKNIHMKRQQSRASASFLTFYQYINRKKKYFIKVPICFNVIKNVNVFCICNYFEKHKNLLKEIILIQGSCQLFLIFVFNNNMFENIIKLIV